MYSERLTPLHFAWASMSSRIALDTRRDTVTNTSSSGSFARAFDW